jgi:signal transduction histidine kinase
MQAAVADEQRVPISNAANLSSERLFDAVPYWITIQDRDLRVIGTSAKLIADFGDHLGEKCYAAYKNRSEPCAECVLRRTFEDGQEHTSQEALFDAQGMPRHVLAKTSPVRNHAGEIAAVMKVYVDVTEIRALQNELAGLGQLIGEIAHDAKNILDGLQGGVYIVNLGFGNGNQEDIRVGWGMIQRNVGRLSAMLMDMLYCAKRRSPRRMPVSLPAVLREAVDLFTPRARQCHIDLQLKAAEDVEILGEPEQIHKLVSNLICNAIDACTADLEKQGPHRIGVVLSRDELDAIIEVEDNGVGMDGTTRDVLFKNGTTTKGSAGNGLGLLLARKVASEHGGEIAVRSQPGKGSVFTVRLPARHPKSILA